MLHFNESAGHSIGIDIGVNYLLGILTDLNGNIQQEKVISFNNLSYEEIEQKLFETIDHLSNSAPESPYGIIGIGVGVLGTVDKNGNILLTRNLEWKNRKLKEVLESKCKLQA